VTENKMTQVSIEESQLKEALKTAIIEIFEERQDLFYDLIVEIAEDIALANAIKEGENSASISKEAVLEILKGQV
jgi:hypothetical protein